MASSPESRRFPPDSGDTIQLQAAWLQIVVRASTVLHHRAQIGQESEVSRAAGCLHFIVCMHTWHRRQVSNST